MYIETCPETILRYMGRSFTVLAIATTDAAANAYMLEHANAAVLHVDRNGVVYMADKADHGHIGVPLSATR